MSTTVLSIYAIARSPSLLNTYQADFKFVFSFRNLINPVSMSKVKMVVPGE